MIRTANFKDTTLELFTDRGSYFLSKKMLGKLILSIKIPKSEIDYVKTCSDNELYCYLEDKQIARYF